MTGDDYRHVNPADGKSDASPSGPGVSSQEPRVNPGNDDKKFRRVVPAETEPVRDTPPPDDLKNPTRAP